MARQSRHDKPIDQIKTEIARSRDQVGSDLRELRAELDFPRKLKRSFQRQTVAWVTAAIIVGTLLVVLPARKKKVYVEAKTDKSKSKKKIVEAGFALGALKFAATLLKPAVVAFVTKKVRGYANEPSARRKW